VTTNEALRAKAQRSAARWLPQRRLSQNKLPKDRDAARGRAERSHGRRFGSIRTGSENRVAPAGLASRRSKHDECVDRWTRRKTSDSVAEISTARAHRPQRASLWRYSPPGNVRRHGIPDPSGVADSSSNDSAKTSPQGSQDFPHDRTQERVGFEPTDGSSPSAVFKTAAFDRSAISPSAKPLAYRLSVQLPLCATTTDRPSSVHRIERPGRSRTSGAFAADITTFDARFDMPQARVAEQSSREPFALPHKRRYLKTYVRQPFSVTSAKTSTVAKPIQTATAPTNAAASRCRRRRAAMTAATANVTIFPASSTACPPTTCV